MSFLPADPTAIRVPVRIPREVARDSGIMSPAIPI
jgi:hypothetical protein